MDPRRRTDHAAIVEALSALAAGEPFEGSADDAQQAHLAAIAREGAAARGGEPFRVLEIGFNAGVSAAAFLGAAPSVHVVSLDLGAHRYVEPCAAYLQDRFPGRHELVVGDSTVTLPEIAARLGRWADLVFVDGGHDRDTCRADVLNGRAIAAPGALVVVDDLLPHVPWGVEVLEQWEALLAEGVLTTPRVWRSLAGEPVAQPDTGHDVERSERRWGLAHYADR